MSFTIATFYWGNQENLDSYVDHCLQYTDDVVVVFIDLFGKKLTNDKARMYYIDHKLYLERGSGQIYSLARDYAKYDWVFLLDASKRTTSLNYDLAGDLDNRSEAGFCVVQKGNSNGSWVKVTNTKKTAIVGVMHEEPQAIDIVGDAIYPFGKEVFAEIEYANQLFNSEFEKNVCDGYRAIGRLKWYYLFNHKKLTANPQSFINSMRDLNEFWQPYGEDFLDNYYNRHKNLYTLDREELVNQLGSIDEWRKYPI